MVDWMIVATFIVGVLNIVEVLYKFFRKDLNPFHIFNFFVGSLCITVAMLRWF